MSATRHWIALDDAFSRLVPAAAARHTRERLGHRAEVLSEIYLARLLKAIAEPATDRNDLSPYIDELRLTHQALTAAVTGAWKDDQAQGAVDGRG